jgi:hypothetical protein
MSAVRETVLETIGDTALVPLRNIVPESPGQGSASPSSPPASASAAPHASHGGIARRPDRVRQSRPGQHGRHRSSRRSCGIAADCSRHNNRNGRCYGGARFARVLALWRAIASRLLIFEQYNAIKIRDQIPGAARSNALLVSVSILGIAQASPTDAGERVVDQVASHTG